MPNDVITQKALAFELNSKLHNYKIDKIYQPEKDEIILLLRGEKLNQRLVISANPTFPRIHLTNQKKENKLVAPAFLMLLRKYINGGRITAIEIFNNDRIIKITVISSNEMKDKVTYYLMVELMGRYSNIILINDNNIILDAIKRIPFEETTSRFIMPNLKYTDQKQDKLTLDNVKGIKDLLNAQNDKLIDLTFLMNNISGFSKETVNEILARSKDPNDIVSNITFFFNIAQEKDYKPCVSLDKNNNPKDVYVLPYTSINAEFKEKNSLNEAFDDYFAFHDSKIRKEANTKHLTLALKRMRDRNKKRLNLANKKIEECAYLDNYKKKGEILTANLFRVKFGQESVTLFDYYENCDIDIELDKTLSPQKNAEKYFKRYTKLKRAQAITQEQLKEIDLLSKYLDSIETSINNSSTREEYEEISEELMEIGAIKRSNNKAKKQKPTQPLHFNVDGYDVYVGKNNQQNNQVTFKIGSGNDIWFHVKGYSGSHVILKNHNNDVQDKVIEKVAKLAVEYSSVNTSCKMQVDYCKKKYVKKIPNAMMGMVTYSNYKTIVIDNLP